MNNNIEMSLRAHSCHEVTENPSVTFFSSANVPPAIDVIAVAQEQQLDGRVGQSRIRNPLAYRCASTAFRCSLSVRLVCTVRAIRSRKTAMLSPRLW